jgi:hypothetical protein
MKPERNMTSAGKQTFISPYNKGRKLFIIPKLHTQQQSMFCLPVGIEIVPHFSTTVQPSAAPQAIPKITHTTTKHVF